MANKLGDHLSSSNILKTHMLSGFDVTSKIGTKYSAIKNNPERFLENFGYFGIDAAYPMLYLVNVIQPSSTCRIFDELRHEMHYTQKRSF